MKWSVLTLTRHVILAEIYDGFTQRAGEDLVLQRVIWGRTFDLVETWGLKPEVLLSHPLEAPAIKKESIFRSSGCDAMSLSSVSWRLQARPVRS